MLQHYYTPWYCYWPPSHVSAARCSPVIVPPCIFVCIQFAFTLAQFCPVDILWGSLCSGEPIPWLSQVAEETSTAVLSLLTRPFPPNSTSPLLSQLQQQDTFLSKALAAIILALTSVHAAPQSWIGNAAQALLPLLRHTVLEGPTKLALENAVQVRPVPETGSCCNFCCYCSYSVRFSSSFRTPGAGAMIRCCLSKSFYLMRHVAPAQLPLLCLPLHTAGVRSPFYSDVTSTNWAHSACADQFFPCLVCFLRRCSLAFDLVLHLYSAFVVLFCSCMQALDSNIMDEQRKRDFCRRCSGALSVRDMCLLLQQTADDTKASYVRNSFASRGSARAL